MARIRTIKPEFWTDERVGECSVSARLLFIAAWNFADDKGGLDRSAKQLKAQAFPYDVIDCEPLVQELLRQRLLIEYEANGRKYLHINGFLKHQKIDNPAKPRIPPYEEQPEKAEDSPRTPRGLAAEGKGRESKGEEGKGSCKSAREAPRETFFDWHDFIVRTHPNTSHRRDYHKAAGNARILVNTGRASQEDLIRRHTGFAEFVQGGGYSGPDKVPTPQTWYEPHLDDPYWAKEWAAPESKADKRLAANVSVLDDFVRSA